MSAEVFYVVQFNGVLPANSYVLQDLKVDLGWNGEDAIWFTALCWGEPPDGFEQGCHLPYVPGAALYASRNWAGLPQTPAKAVKTLATQLADYKPLLLDQLRLPDGTPVHAPRVLTQIQGLPLVMTAGPTPTVPEVPDGQRVSDSPEYKRLMELRQMVAGYRVKMLEDAETKVHYQALCQQAEGEIRRLKSTLRLMLAQQEKRDLDRKRDRQERRQWRLLTLRNQEGRQILRATDKSVSRYMLDLHTAGLEWFVTFSQAIQEHEFTDIPEDLKSPPSWP